MNKTEEQWKSMIGNDSHLYNDQESPGEYLWTVTPSKGMPTYLIPGRRFRRKGNLLEFSCRFVMYLSYRIDLFIWYVEIEINIC